MPTYQYVCTECGAPLEAVQKFADDPLTVHEECGGRLRKVFSPVGIVFKGSGFYRTDSRGKPSSESKSSDSNSSDSKSADSKPSESKSADSGSKSSSESSSSKSSGSSDSNGSKSGSKTSTSSGAKVA